MLGWQPLMILKHDQRILKQEHLLTFEVTLRTFESLYLLRMRRGALWDQLSK